MPVRLARLPSGLDGLCIAQLSDVHAGLAMRERDLEEAVRLLRRARPDLIVLTGDLVDHDPAYLPDVGRLARRVVDIQPRFGVFAVLGNHDYYAGAERVLEVLRRGGVTTLRNDGVRIVDGGRGLGLAGVDDVSAARYAPGHAPDLSRALAPLDPEDARVLLCYDPVQFTESAGSIDLQLSGHTHGGQPLGGVAAEILFPHGYIAGLRGPRSPEVSRIVLLAGRGPVRALSAR